MTKDKNRNHLFTSKDTICRADFSQPAKPAAFTLAEILITLGIIGIVAAMTIPTLMEKMRVRQTVSKLRAAQAVFSEAYKLAVNENGDADGWDIGTMNTANGAEKLYNILKPHMKNAQDCGTKQGCFEADYKSLSGKTNASWQPRTHAVYSRGVLMNGIQYAVWSGGSGCNINYSKSGFGDLSEVCGWIYVDINGNTKPNQAGVDFFKFIITKNGIVPAGRSDQSKDLWNSICEYNNNSGTNGTACTAWVLEKQNMDYLKKPISW